MPLKPWKLIDSRIEKKFPIFDLRVDRAQSPRTGREHDFFILESADWVNVIPVTPEKEVVLIRQYRHGLREITLEIPGGILEPGDSPAAAARRELSEETGYEGGTWSALDYVSPNPAFLNNRCYTFLAEDVVLKRGQEQDDKEDIEITLEPLQQIPRLIREGRIRHSLIVAAFYRLMVEHPEFF
ncbi:MAG: NUDIX hydrolase [Desulfobacteraceae bacterium]|nr:MAG: NUDIX hydrolase [Desulfobacteraceae bacterium]